MSYRVVFDGIHRIGERVEITFGQPMWEFINDEIVTTDIAPHLVGQQGAILEIQVDREDDLGNSYSLMMDDGNEIAWFNSTQLKSLENG